MKRRPSASPFASERGSVMLVAMCFTLVLALALASYQTMAYHTPKMGSRNLQSLRAREVAEAGLEDAVWALNNASSDHWSGWTLAGGNATKTLGGFAYESAAVTGQAALSVTNYAYASTGTGAKPTITAVSTVTGADGTSVTRTLSAGTGISATSASGRAPLFTNAIAAVGNGSSGTGQVYLYSGGVKVDSYDSSAGSFTSGYSAVVAAEASPDLSVTSSLSGSARGTVTLNNSVVQGYVATTATTANTVAMTELANGNSTSAKVIGTSGATGIDASRLSTSPYQNLFSILTPTGTSITPPSGTVALGSGTYYANDGGSGTFSIYSGTLDVTGDVVLVVPGNLNINSSGSIVIEAGGSLQIVVAGSANIYGLGINNTTHIPSKLAIFASGAASSVTFWTAQSFYGVAYAPSGSITIFGSGSGSNAFEVFGSLVGRNVTVYPYSGYVPNIHYDVKLLDAVFSQIDTPFAVSNIAETP